MNPPYRTYPTRAGTLALAVGNDAQFGRFAAALAHPEWATDPRLATNSARVVNREVVDRLVEEALAGETAEVWITRLRAAGVPCGRVSSVAEALADPQALGMPFKLGGTPVRVRRPPPTLGQHTEEILRELGLEVAEIARLRGDGVI